jgi:hypothetical protein
MTKACMDTDCLRVVKVFLADSYTHLLPDMKACLVRALGKILGCFDVDPIVIPATYLESNQILAIQFLCVDLLQMNV